MICGKVTRPNYGAGDGELVLTATVTVGSVTKIIKYDASVKEKGMTDTQIVAADKLALEFPVDQNNIKENVQLPSVGTNGSTITWQTNKDSVMTADGVITRPVNGAPSSSGLVTMTATITKGNITETKVFECTVLPWTDEEESQFDADMITWETIRGKNISKTDVTLDLELPTEGSRGSTITWVSNNEAIISNEGSVTRPSYTQGDVIIALSATVTKNSVSKKVNITGIRVLKKAMTNKEAVEKAVNGIDVASIKGENASLAELTRDMILPKKSSFPDCSTVQLTWSVVKGDGNTADASNANIRIVDNGDDFLCRITRPLNSERNVEAGIKCVADSSLLAEGEASSYKVFPVVILKEEGAAAANMRNEEVTAKVATTKTVKK